MQTVRKSSHRKKGSVQELSEAEEMKRLHCPFIWNTMRNNFPVLTFLRSGAIL